MAGLASDIAAALLQMQNAIIHLQDALQARGPVHSALSPQHGNVQGASQQSAVQLLAKAQVQVGA